MKSLGYKVQRKTKQGGGVEGRGAMVEDGGSSVLSELASRFTA